MPATLVSFEPAAGVPFQDSEGARTGISHTQVQRDLAPKVPKSGTKGDKKNKNGGGPNREEIEAKIQQGELSLSSRDDNS